MEISTARVKRAKLFEKRKINENLRAYALQRGDVHHIFVKYRENISEPL